MKKITFIVLPIIALMFVVPLGSVFAQEAQVTLLVEDDQSILMAEMPKITLPASEIGRLYRELKAKGWSDADISSVRTTLGTYLLQALKIQVAIKRMAGDAKM